MLIIILLLITPAGCIKTKKAEAFQASNVSIINITTDKPGYSPGDTVTGGVIVRNISNTTVNQLNLKLTARNLNYAWAGDRAQTKFSLEYTDLNLMPGDSTDLGATINIPREVSGFSTAGDYELKVEVFLEGRLCDFKILKMKVS